MAWFSIFLAIIHAGLFQVAFFNFLFFNSNLILHALMMMMWWLVNTLPGLQKKARLEDTFIMIATEAA